MPEGRGKEKSGEQAGIIPEELRGQAIEAIYGENACQGGREADHPRLPYGPEPHNQREQVDVQAFAAIVLAVEDAEVSGLGDFSAALLPFMASSAKSPGGALVKW